MAAAPTDYTVLCIDLGKTSCRAAVLNSHEILATADLEGVPAEADSGAVAAERVLATISLLPTDLANRAGACGVGAAGTLTDPTAGRRIADLLRDRLGRPVAVTSDIITAHLGAFRGGAGVTLVAGTGAVAVDLSCDGSIRRVDGWGPDIGDLGGGSWIGREGMRAVLGAECGLRPSTALTTHLQELTAGVHPVQWVAESGNHAQQLARFAPIVLDQAESGDRVALGIVNEAITLLTATASAAGAASDPGAAAPSAPVPSAAWPTGATGTAAVAILGGLTRHPWFNARLSRGLTASGLTVTTPAGDALRGAFLAAVSSDLPHERHIHRA